VSNKRDYIDIQVVKSTRIIAQSHMILLNTQNFINTLYKQMFMRYYVNVMTLHHIVYMQEDF